VVPLSFSINDAVTDCERRDAHQSKKVANAKGTHDFEHDGVDVPK
jgi:hypothetical protein